jgi:predicted RNase H-like HicB family nuclease
MADGESLSDVTEAIDEAIKLWIEVNQARGVEIPEPKGRLMFA